MTNQRKPWNADEAILAAAIRATGRDPYAPPPPPTYGSDLERAIAGHYEKQAEGKAEK